MPKVITDEVRWKVVCKWLCGASVKETMEHLMISKTSVSKIRRIYRANGTIAPWMFMCGRNRKLDNDDMVYLGHLLEQNPDWYLEEIQGAMEEFCGKSISKSTIWRSLDRLGITHKQVSKRYLICGYALL